MTKNKTQIAIIVPVFNGANFLKEKIEEALKFQEMFDVKYYFVDDGSTDATARILSVVPSVTTVHHNKNQGLFIARQTGLQLALRDPKNTHFLFSDADDFIYAEALEKVFKKLIFGFNKVLMFTLSNKIEFTSPSEITFKFKLHKGIPYIFCPLLCVYVIPRQKIHWFKSDTMYKGKFEDGFVSHPFILGNHKKVFVTNDPLFRKTKRSNSITSNNRATYLDDIFVASKILIQKTSFFPYKSSVVYVVFQEMFSHLFRAYKNPNYNLAQQSQKVFYFIKSNFDSQPIWMAWRRLSYPRKLLWLLIMCRLVFAQKVAFKLITLKLHHRNKQNFLN